MLHNWKLVVCVFPWNIIRYHYPASLSLGVCYENMICPCWILSPLWHPHPVRCKGHRIHDLSNSSAYTAPYVTAMSVVHNDSGLLGNKVTFCNALGVMGEDWSMWSHPLTFTFCACNIQSGLICWIPVQYTVWSHTIKLLMSAFTFKGYCHHLG